MEGSRSQFRLWDLVRNSCPVQERLSVNSMLEFLIHCFARSQSESA